MVSRFTMPSQLRSPHLLWSKFLRQFSAKRFVLVQELAIVARGTRTVNALVRGVPTSAISDGRWVGDDVSFPAFRESA
ncbi:hypothetical protein EJ04DRAFT_41287 [Polyplosphaeria fusca]|uniref:Uncharacterized protein n=1 Tax=Polyplosphaeria fusca TaxID=682080 RepID=A0A9P4V5B4_9PLEO|nr:hypothetical protein EJ04DRAFT_41287 [Polyplosphaeria fusca]